MANSNIVAINVSVDNTCLGFMELPGSLQQFTAVYGPNKGQNPGIPYGYHMVCTQSLLLTVRVFARIVAIL